MRNLLGRLHDRAPHELELIARWWEIELRGRDRFSIAGHLYRTMTDAWAFALAWGRLTPVERTLLEHLADQEPALTLDAISQPIGIGVIGLRESVDRLVRVGFLFVEQGELHSSPEQDAHYFLPRELAQLTARLRAERGAGLPTASSVDELLDRLNDGALADIAEHMGRQIIPAVALRADLLAQIAPRLADPEHLKNTVRGLNPSLARLWRRLLDRPTPDIPGEARESLGLTNADFRLAVQGLAQRGLLWRGFAPDGTLRLVVPDVLRNPRKVAELPPPELEVVSDEAVDAIDWLFPYATAWDLLTLMRASTNGLLGRRRSALEVRPGVIRRLARLLWRRSGEVPPTGYLQFLDYFATGLSLVDGDGSGATSEPQRAWTLQSFKQQTQSLFDLWMAASDWPESTVRETVQIWGGDWPAFRARLLEALGELSPGSWVTLESFALRFVHDAPGALGAHFTAAASHDQRAESAEGRRSAILQTVVELTLRTAGEWLGLVTLSTARRRAVFSLTEVGAWLSGEQPEPPDELELGAHPLSVLPSFEILLPRPTSRRVWALSAFAELVRLDRVSSYELTRASIGRGLSAGLSTSQITGFLEHQGEDALPQNVAFEIENWARSMRRVVVRDTVLLESDGAESGAKIAEALTSAGFRVERLSGDRLLVFMHDGEHSQEFSGTIDDRLRELGYTPLRRQN